MKTKNNKEYNIKIADKNILLSFSNWAEQSNSIIARMGDTVILSSVVSSKKNNDPGYFPLTVEYRENYYAAGKIGGGRFHKREGRPSDEAILKARLIDRALRPLFNQHIRNEIQVVNSVLSYDGQNSPETLSLVASATALMVSDIPFNGPLAAIQIAKTKGEIIINPTVEEQQESPFVITIAGDGEKINMLEIGAKETTEEEIQKAINFSLEFLSEITSAQKQIQNEIGVQKKEMTLKEAGDDVKRDVKESAFEPLKQKLFTKDKKEYESVIESVRADTEKILLEKYEDEENVSLGLDYIDELIDEIMRDAALKENKRIDGRAFDEIRDLSGDVGVLPRTHGSAIFMRGLTHVLSSVTLAILGNEELKDDMMGDREKRFMHHYNFPSFSVGETGPFRGPGRREIGHGALAEKALAPLIPDVESFPYVTRLVSEVLSSNGSSSMGSVCASSLSLFNAGVPIKSHVGGIAMGLILGENNNFKVLTDIQGPEDHHGNMDLKVAGTRKGITAAQMDIKALGITTEILNVVFVAAKKARLQIIDALENIASEPNKELSPYAPLVQYISIDPEKIGAVIGSGGSVIKEIQKETETEINIKDDGSVCIGGVDEENIKKAVQWVKALTHTVSVGEQYLAKVSKITDFGAFVALTKEKEALIHISELKENFVKNVSDEVSVGQRILAKVIGVDQSGKISATAKNLNKNDATLNFLDIL